MEEITNAPYDSDAHGYRDPVFSNSSGGAQPNVSVNDIRLRGSYILTATLGRGLWTIPTP